MRAHVTGTFLNNEERFNRLYQVRLAARTGKQTRPEKNRCTSHLLEHLHALNVSIKQGKWQSSQAYRFVVTHPKAREVCAATFQDRVVHHYLVTELQKIWEPKFIFDAASNRVGKRTHFAVNRLQRFMRQYNGKAWYLQLDIKSFFHSIDQGVLLNLLAHGTGKTRLFNDAEKKQLLNLSREVIGGLKPERAIQLATSSELSRVPRHKQLARLPKDIGLPIGNLTSQFFANVYMNALDQFVNHSLKCKHYVRYVDDFVLVHDNPEQLSQWQKAIERFLHTQLHLALKADPVLRRVEEGADFLGYIVYPWHKTVRKRVVGHCRHKLNLWQKKSLLLKNNGILVSGESITDIALVMQSYWGHFQQASSCKLKKRFFKDYPWLDWLKGLTPKATQCVGLINQHQFFVKSFPNFLVILQKGYRIAVAKTLMLQVATPELSLREDDYWLTLPKRHLRALTYFLTD